jgi:hypothetical protein
MLPCNCNRIVCNAHNHVEVARVRLSGENIWWCTVQCIVCPRLCCRHIYDIWKALVAEHAAAASALPDEAFEQEQLNEIARMCQSLYSGQPCTAELTPLKGYSRSDGTSAALSQQMQPLLQKISSARTRQSYTASSAMPESQAASASVETESTVIARPARSPQQRSSTLSFAEAAIPSAIRQVHQRLGSTLRTQDWGTPADIRAFLETLSPSTLQAAGVMLCPSIPAAGVVLSDQTVLNEQRSELRGTSLSEPSISTSNDTLPTPSP